MKRKLEHSEYISSARPAAKALLDRALTLFDFASVLFIDSRGKNYRVSASGVSVSDEPLFCSRGMVLRFAKDGRIGEISRPDLSEEDIDGILDKARELLSQEGDFLEYIIVGESGPDHQKRFDVEARLNSNVIGKGSGKSKREAEQNAAKAAIELFGVEM